MLLLLLLKIIKQQQQQQLYWDIIDANWCQALITISTRRKWKKKTKGTTSEVGAAKGKKVEKALQLGVVVFNLVFCFCSGNFIKENNKKGGKKYLIVITTIT